MRLFVVAAVALLISAALAFDSPDVCADIPTFPPSGLRIRRGMATYSFVSDTEFVCPDGQSEMNAAVSIFEGDVHFADSTISIPCPVVVGTNTAVVDYGVFDSLQFRYYTILMYAEGAFCVKHQSFLGNLPPSQ